MGDVVCLNDTLGGGEASLALVDERTVEPQLGAVRSDYCLAQVLRVELPTSRRGYETPAVAVGDAENEPQRSDSARRVALGAVFEIEVEAPFGSPVVLRGQPEIVGVRHQVWAQEG